MSDILDLTFALCEVHWNRTNIVSWFPPIPEAVTSLWSKLLHGAVVNMSGSKCRGSGTIAIDSIHSRCLSSHVCMESHHLAVTDAHTKEERHSNERRYETRNPAFAKDHFTVHDEEWCSSPPVMQDINNT